MTAIAEVALNSVVQQYDGVDAMLDDARSRLVRISARAAFQELIAGDALLLDIRPATQREQEGEVAP